jgi:hypothetical protein
LTERDCGDILRTIDIQAFHAEPFMRLPMNGERKNRVAGTTSIVALRRLVWAGLFAGHLFILPSAIRALARDGVSGSVILRLTILSLSVVFLYLKLIDVPCLRLASGWRSVTASITLVAFLHVTAVERASNGAVSARTSQTVILAFAGTTAAAESLRSVIKQLFQRSVRLFSSDQLEEGWHFALCWLKAPRFVPVLWFNWIPAQFAARPPPRL